MHHMNIYLPRPTSCAYLLSKQSPIIYIGMPSVHINHATIEWESLSKTRKQFPSFSALRSLLWQPKIYLPVSQRLFSMRATSSNYHHNTGTKIKRFTSSRDCMKQINCWNDGLQPETCQLGQLFLAFIFHPKITKIPTYSTVLWRTKTRADKKESAVYGATAGR